MSFICLLQKKTCSFLFFSLNALFWHIRMVWITPILWSWSDIVGKLKITIWVLSMILVLGYEDLGLNI